MPEKNDEALVLEIERLKRKLKTHAQLEEAVTVSEQKFKNISSSAQDAIIQMDDKGFWNHLEIYIQAHSEASFSHGICPDCRKTLYADLS